jgi:hypothetical protein
VRPHECCRASHRNGASHEANFAFKGIGEFSESALKPTGMTPKASAPTKGHFELHLADSPALLNCGNRSMPVVAN